MINPLLLCFPKQTLCVQPHERLHGSFYTRVACSSQDGCRCVAKKAEVQRGGGADDRRALLRWTGGRVPLRGAGSTSVRWVAIAFTTNLSGDGELGGVFSILAKQVREEAATCVDEPVTYLGREVKCLAWAELILKTEIFTFKIIKLTSKMHFPIFLFHVIYCNTLMLHLWQPPSALN